MKKKDLTEVMPYFDDGEYDSFSYVLKLKNGEVFEYAHLEHIDKEWTRIFFCNDELKGKLFPFPRGLDIKKSEIVWVSKAHKGS